jgi:Mn-dependent DtxR family transcriptional regulator
MLRKLADKGLVNYVKYKGVSLTDEGQRAALRTLRKHRFGKPFWLKSWALVGMKCMKLQNNSNTFNRQS